MKQQRTKTWGTWTTAYFLCLFLRATSECEPINPTGHKCRNESISASAHSDVLLRFVVQDTVVDPLRATLNWQTDSWEVVHAYHDGEDQLDRQAERFHGRTEVFPKDIHDGNASLLLKNISWNDTRTYCAYFFPSDDGNHCECCSVQLHVSDSHSYRHLYTGVSNPGPDVPAFTAVGYVDDQQILRYDSETRRQEPCRDWVRGAVDPDFWDEETRSLQGWQRGFDMNLITLQHRYNQSRGSRTLQLAYGCELRADNSTGGHMQWGYDGGDFIGYDLGARTWVAGTARAQVTQHSWNRDAALLRTTRAYLEETCVAWLRQYLQRGEAALQSKRPVAQVSDRPSSRDGRTTLSCWVHGFYPEDVAVAWLKDGEAQPRETSRSGVLPSGDGTYQTWATIEMDPSSNHDYACSVEHASLGAALRVAWDKGRTASDPAMIVGIVIGVVLVIALAGAAVSFRRKRAVGCRAVPG